MELNLVSGLGDACLLKRLPFGSKQKKRERLLRLPSHEALEALVNEMHLQSSALRALPPAGLWPEHSKRSWEEACAEFTAQLKAALDDGSELATLQIVLDFSSPAECCFPSWRRGRGSRSAGRRTGPRSHS